MESKRPLTNDSESSSDSFLDSYENFLQSLDTNAMDTIANAMDANAMDAIANAVDTNAMDAMANAIDAHELERNVTRASEENPEISGPEQVGLSEKLGLETNSASESQSSGCCSNSVVQVTITLRRLFISI